MNTPAVILTMNANGEPVYGYEVQDMVIFNPRASVCGRFAVSPAEYGLTDEQVDQLAALNRQHGYDDAL